MKLENILGDVNDTMERNNFSELLKSAYVNEKNVLEEAEKLSAVFPIEAEDELLILLKSITLLDLTSLSSDDTFATISKLCSVAVKPIVMVGTKSDEDQTEIRTASVCVYPSRIQDARNSMAAFTTNPLPIAAVAGGFPSGQYPLSSRVAEVAWSVSQGASEIDIVVDRSLVLTRKWDALHREVESMVLAGKGAKIKVILAVGECGSLENILRASLICMDAGAHFIKTSTGKEAVNATLPVGIVMCRAIKMFYMRYGRKVGFKPAGGIRTYQDTLKWAYMIKKELGDDWLDPSLFRIGASSVLTSIVERINVLNEQLEKSKK